MLRIKKLDIFIAKQFGLLFMGTFFICQFVLMMQFLWRYIDELIGKGLTMDVMAQFFWYMGLMLVPQALPLAILLSSLMTFGNLGESSELTAIKAAGISLMQAFRSLIVITVIIERPHVNAQKLTCHLTKHIVLVGERSLIKLLPLRLAELQHVFQNVRNLIDNEVHQGDWIFIQLK